MATPAGTRPGVRWGRWLLALLLLMAIGLPLALQTRAGIDILLQLVLRASGGAVQLGSWQGAWLSDLQLRELTIRAGTTRIHVDRLRLRWSAAALWQRRLHVTQLQFGRMTIDSPPSAEPLQMPRDLRLPLDVYIDAFACDRLLLLPAGVELTALSASATAADGQYRLTLERLHSPWGRLGGKAQLAMQAPFVLQATARAGIGVQGRALDAVLQAGGNLAQLQLRVEGRTGGTALSASAQLRPFAGQLPRILPRASVRAQGVDLHQWLAEAPASDLDIDLLLQPQADAVRFGFRLQNRLAGSLDQQRLPLLSASGDALLDNRQLRLYRLDARLPRGSATAQGVAARNRLALQLTLDDVDARGVWSKLQSTRFDGRLQLDGTPLLPRITGQLSDPRLAAVLDVAIDRRAAAPRIDVRQLDLAARNAEARIAGKLDFAARRPFALSAAFSHFNPAAFGAFPAAELNGGIEASGSLLPAPQGRLALSITRSQFNHLPLTALGQLQFTGQRVQQAELSLQLGQNRLQANGTLGRAGDRLHLLLTAPDLAAIGQGWRGAATVDAELAGSYLRPALSGSVHIERLAIPQGVEIGQLVLQANIPDQTAAPAEAQARLVDARIGGLRLEGAELQLNGTPKQHRVQLSADGALHGRAARLVLAAAGGWSGAAGWQGVLERLTLDGNPSMALQRPASLIVAQQHFSLGAATFSVAGGTFDLRRTEWHAGALLLDGSADAIELASLLQLLSDSSPLSTDLRLAASWSLAFRDGWSGSARLARSSGDLQVKQGVNGQLRDIPLQLQAAELQLTAMPGKTTLAGQLRSRDFGRADVFAELWPAGAPALLPAAGSPVSAAATLEMPSLAWLGPLLGPQFTLAGRLAGQLALQGVLGNVHWSGGVSGDDVALRNPDWGMAYRNGSVRAAIVAEGVYVNECRFSSGDGTLSAQGELLFAEKSAAGRLKVVVDRFAAINRPDLQLTVSGSTDAKLADDKFDLSGNLRADNGFFRFTKSGVPSLSDDVIIVGRRDTRPSNKQKLPVSIVLDLDLGESLHFEGWGIKTGLTGGVRVKSVRGQPLNVSGTVRSTEGRYSAYGQDLKISHGVLAFQGPLDNPGLDVIAVREHLAVEPGIHLTGSLQSPRLSLIADSDMSEHEKLSWLVLGRPPGEGGQQKADADLLIAAASALLSSDQSSSLQQQLAARFGIDEIGLRSRNGENTAAQPGGNGAAAQQVVAIGKRLSDKAYVVYEQGVDAASAAVKLTYRVSRRWSLVAKAGQESQFDVFWNFWFD